MQILAVNNNNVNSRNSIPNFKSLMVDANHIEFQRLMMDELENVAQKGQKIQDIKDFLRCHVVICPKTDINRKKPQVGIIITSNPEIERKITEDFNNEAEHIDTKKALEMIG